MLRNASKAALVTVVSAGNELQIVSIDGHGFTTAGTFARWQFDLLALPYGLDVVDAYSRRCCISSKMFSVT